MSISGAELNAFVVKITNFCDLNCDYCYMFNLADKSYKTRPSVMPLDVRAATVRAIVDHVAKYDLKEVHVILHGGEPLLAGKEYVRTFFNDLQAAAPEGVFHFGMQTNGVKLDHEWIKLFRECGVSIGVSLDGTPEVHDLHRVRHDGRGSYQDVRRSLDMMLSYPNVADFFGGVLCVIEPAHDGLALYRHFREIGVKAMDFLLPLSYNWDNPPLFSESAISDYLIPIFDEWWSEADPTITIRLFANILNLICGGRRSSDAVGGNPIRSVMIEADGSIEPLDVLRVCADGFTRTNLNVLMDPISSILSEEVFVIASTGAEGIPDGCKGCPVEDICGGGYLPNRFSKNRLFNNPNIHCLSLSKLILHMVSRLSELVRPEHADFAQQLVLPNTIENPSPTLPLTANRVSEEGILCEF